MRSLRLSSDFVTLSEFKAEAATWATRLASTGQPLVVTQNGKPAYVVLSPAAYDALTERTRVVAAVEEGLADVEAGRTLSHEALLARRAKRREKRRSGKPRQ